MKKSLLNRRKFLGQAGCAALSSCTMLSSLLNLRSINAAAISDSTVLAAGDYKALVCISLGGGNDSFNMLLPNSPGEYSAYQATRGNLALNSSSLRQLSTTYTANRSFALHPSLSNIQNLFNQGNAAFVANVGTLIEPIANRTEYGNESKRTPLGLLSHSDQLQQWMTAIPHDRSGIGWGGRIADMIKDMNSNTGISMNISLDGTNIFQTGTQTIEYAVDARDGAKEIIGYNDDYQFNTLRKNAINSMLEQNYSDIFEKTYINTLRSATHSYQEFNQAISSINLSTSFVPDDYNLSDSLKMIAKIIASRTQLGFSRQTFFVNFGGWDHHDEVLNNQANMFSILDSAIGSFQNAMVELGTENCVVGFLISDFARTLTSNGNGSDHAWGGNVFTFGGPVIGERIYGSFPESLNYNLNTVDLGGGILIPTTAADLYFAELALWFGVSKSNLELIFPNLRNFYQYESTNLNPLNFLTI